MRPSPKILAGWQPSWNTPVGEARRGNGAMGADSLDTARRVREPIRDDNDIENAFDGITYSKGSAVLRIAWSPWLAIAGIDPDSTAPRACLAQHGTWTQLVAPAGGTFTIEARYSLDRGTPCPHAHHGPGPRPDRS